MATEPLSAESLKSILIKIDLDVMARDIFKVDYSILKDSIYPNPIYKTFLVAKRNGGYRVISEPRNNLKQYQLKLLDYLYKNSGNFKSCVHGFVPKRSIVSNALQHCSSRTKHILNIDLKDFFPSITFYRVRGLFMNRPFDFSYEIATVLAQICCYKGSLPQGAPTSPIIANLICRGLDKELMSLAQKHRAIYSRYCDDITFSFTQKNSEKLPKNICSFDSGIVELGDELQTIVNEHSFAINSDKTRVSNIQHRLEVTGITINKFPNVQRVFIDEIRGALHAWERYGYEQANEEFAKRKYKRATRTRKIPQLSNYIRGKIVFLKMVRGIENEIYTKLTEKYNTLCSKQEKIDKTFTYKKLITSEIIKSEDDAQSGVFVVECIADHPEGMIYGQGTAFFIQNLGLITCEHVLKNNGVYFEDMPGAEINIVDAATKKSWPVKCIKKDEHRDLAILEIVGTDKPKHKIFSTKNSSISIKEEGIVMGFPNYAPGRILANHHPVRILNSFSVSGLKRIEVSELIRAGNSGGPLLDKTYRVAGIVQHGATLYEGNNDCLCITEIIKWAKS